LSAAVSSSKHSSPRRRRLWVLLLTLLLPPATAAWLLPARPEPPDRPLRVTFLDVGQGDSAVIESPTGRVVVIDGGGRPGTNERDGSDPGSRVVVPFLRRRGVSTVDLLVATHPDDDHVQGLVAVASRLNVRAALESGFEEEGKGKAPAAGRLRALLRARRVPVRRATRGQSIDIGGGARLEVLGPPEPLLSGSPSDANENSVVLRLVYGRARVLFTGDAGGAAESDLLRALPPSALRADVLKAGHHGSRHSTSEEFLAAVRPSAAILSSGKNNLYGHPSPQVMDRLARGGVRAFRTDRQGAITVETDGRRVRVTPHDARQL